MTTEAVNEIEVRMAWSALASLKFHVRQEVVTL